MGRFLGGLVLESPWGSRVLWLTAMAKSLPRPKNVAGDLDPLRTHPTTEGPSRIENYLSARPLFRPTCIAPPGGFGSLRVCSTRSAVARPTVPVQDTPRHRESGRPRRIPRHP